MTADAKRKKAREYNRRWRAANKLKDSEWHRAYYQKHKKRLSGQHARYHKWLYEKHPEIWKDYQYRKKYGLTLADVNAMRAKQKRRCAICRRMKKLNVDHCHRGGGIRGLLCTSCNTALGAFGDSAAIVARALRYMKRKPMARREHIPRRPNSRWKK